MDLNSITPFSFEAPETKPYGLWRKLLAFALILIFMSFPLMYIDSTTFTTGVSSHYRVTGCAMDFINYTPAVFESAD